MLNSVASLDGGGYTNSAFLVTGGRAPERYDKVHLVPFGEFVPVWARLAFTESLVREVGAFLRAKPVVCPERPAGVAICFEVVFPDLIAAGPRRSSALDDPHQRWLVRLLVGAASTFRPGATARGGNAALVRKSRVDRDFGLHRPGGQGGLTARCWRDRHSGQSVQPMTGLTPGCVSEIGGRCFAGR